MVREAGGYVSEISGREHRLDSETILATNDRLYTEIVKVLKSAG